MILFVFEGSSVEPQVYDTIRRLFFSDSFDDITYCFGSDIYSLYDRIRSINSNFNTINGAADVVSILRSMDTQHQLDAINVSSDVSEIYLFFDYDFQRAFRDHRRHPEKDMSTLIAENNVHIGEMLQLFNEETEAGKLYINYPMIESLKYTKELPDERYCSYNVSIEDCHGRFKGLAENFSDYKGYHRLKIEDRVDEELIRRNWELLKEQNIKKANYLCLGSAAMPATKSDIAQDKIFAAQLRKFTKDQRIGILNSFPIFLYDYFK